MKDVKRVEIVTGALEMREVCRVLEEAGVAGYTVVRSVEGRGERGTQSGDDLTDVFKNSYFITAREPEQMETIVEAVRPLLKKRGGACLVSDAQWVRH
jgi:nitrogen regulatory protein PII